MTLEELRDKINQIVERKDAEGADIVKITDPASLIIVKTEGQVINLMDFGE